MRIPLQTDLISRDGIVSKDARLKNCYVEVRGESSAVRRRPSAQGGVAVGSGTAQGGIGFNIAGTDYFIGVWGDTITPYTGGGTTWNSGTAYSIGDHVSVGFKDYWALTDNTNRDPTTNPNDWSNGYVPAVPFSGTYATWDINVSSSGIILSNGYLTETLPASPAQTGGTRSTIWKSSGKWYWELTINTFDNTSSELEIGIVPNTYNKNLAPGSSSNEYAYGTSAYTDVPSHPSLNSYIYNGGNFTNAPFGDTYNSGDTIGVALDMDGGTVVFYKNGILQGVGASGLTGAYFASVGSNINNHSSTANFGASPFAYPVPNGYNPGLYTP